MLDLIKDDFTKIADRCAEVSSELGGTNLNGADGKVESAMKGCRSRTVMQGFESVFNETKTAITDALDKLETDARAAQSDLEAADEKWYERLQRFGADLNNEASDAISEVVDFINPVSGKKWKPVGFTLAAAENGLEALADRTTGKPSQFANDASEIISAGRERIDAVGNDLVDMALDGTYESGRAPEPTDKNRYSILDPIN